MAKTQGSGTRRMEDSDNGTYYGIGENDPWVCSPLMEMLHGPAFRTQPALEGDVPPDDTGLLPPYEFQRYKEKK